MPAPRTMTVLDDGRATSSGREVQTDYRPVVGVPADIKPGDRIVAEYRSTSSYGLWFFVARAKGQEGR